jgi:hypothetical protein
MSTHISAASAITDACNVDDDDGDDESVAADDDDNVDVVRFGIDVVNDDDGVLCGSNESSTHIASETAFPGQYNHIPRFINTWHDYNGMIVELLTPPQTKC